MPKTTTKLSLRSLAGQTGSVMKSLPFPAYLAIAAIIATGFMYSAPLALFLGGAGTIFMYSRRKSYSSGSSDVPDYFGKARFARYNDLVSGKKSYLLGEHTESSQFLSQNFLLGYYVYPQKGRFVSNLIGFKGEGHILTVAQTGAGKGVSVVIPNLLNYSDSTIVVDIKGENFLRTVYRRENDFRNEICLIDPFGVVEHKVQGLINQLRWVKANPDDYLSYPDASFVSSITQIFKKQNKTNLTQNGTSTFANDIDQSIRYFEHLASDVSTKRKGRYIRGINPLQIIKELAAQKRFDEIVDEARAIADMLVVRESHEKDQHWNDKAVEILTLVIMFLVFSERCNIERKTKSMYPINLSSVDYLLNKEFQSKATIDLFIEDCDKHPILSRYSQSLRMAEQERSSVLSTINRHLSPLRSPGAFSSLNPGKNETAQTSDIRIAPKTIYLVLPPDLLSSYKNLSRLWVGSILRSLYSKHSPMGNKRVLFMLDEVAQLGRLDPLVQALTLGRGYGINIWMIFQTIGQLKSIYEKDSGTILANVSISQLFGLGAADFETQEYVSKLCGQKTIEIFTQSSSFSQGKNFSVNSGYSYTSGSSAQGGSSSSSSTGGSSSGSSTNQTESMNNQYQSRNLLNPDEAVRLTQNRHLIIGTPYPTDAVPMKYHEISMFANRYPIPLPIKLIQQLEL